MTAPMMPAIPPREEPPEPKSGAPMGAIFGGIGFGIACALIAIGMVSSSVSSAKERLMAPAAEASKPKIAIADQAELAYCTPEFKKVLERVLHSCGLATDATTRRGCKPADIKTFAAISDDDFNALFTPLKDRGAVLLFDNNADALDEAAAKILDEKWFDRRGARYFFVVSRSSKTGTVDKNRALSHRRANSVMFHLKETSKDPDIEKKAGLLWLGNEFAQLPHEYCTWTNSRPNQKCAEEAINRSAFVSWVDCRL